ncbi:MAG: hypothetical protein JW741_08575 [Sedimentisphaerales bacterium]|nr:hypothetical protein [Sedimentisphaerales bacterium]
MSLAKSFQQKVRAARTRCVVNVLVRQAGGVLTLAGGAVALAILSERLLAVRVLTVPVLWGLASVTAVLVLLLWLLRFPSRMQVSLLLDERLGLRERCSTTLALAQSEHPFARAARSEALRVVQHTDVRRHFPIRFSRHWIYGAGTWLVVVAVLFVPQKDLLGLLRQREQQAQEARQIEQAKSEVEETTESVKAVVKRLDAPELEEELEKLDQLSQAGTPEEVKRQAIKALGDLSEKIKQMQKDGQIEAARMLQQRLRQLRGSTDPLSQKMRMALAKGEFAQAAQILREMQKQMARGELSEAKRKELAEQLQKLAEELRKLAEQKRELEDELEKLGLKKDLAQLSQEQLRQALEQQGLKPELVEQLMDKMAASQGACGLCAGLAQAMGGMGLGAAGFSGDGLSSAIGQLDAMEALQQQAMMLRASLDEISRYVESLGDDMSWGLTAGAVPGNLANPFGIGTEKALSRAENEEYQTATKATRAQSETGSGPLVASWYFKDMQVKGEARRGYTEVVQAGRASAAEAISENQIPRRYEGAVKQYFSQLEGRTTQP